MTSVHLIVTRLGGGLIGYECEFGWNKTKTALRANQRQFRDGLERVTGLEPVTSCLGSKRSTTELHPHIFRGFYTFLEGGTSEHFSDKAFNKSFCCILLRLIPIFPR